MVTNPLRVLDCKVPSCKEHTADAPRILEHNCPDCAAHFETVRRLLDAEKVPYVINHRLVRGLGYYTPDHVRGRVRCHRRSGDGRRRPVGMTALWPSLAEETCPGSVLPAAWSVSPCCCRNTNRFDQNFMWWF